LVATTKLPSPFGCVGVVSNDLAQRVLTVRISDNESGYGRLLWREAFQALRRSEEAGIHGRSVVWASTPDAFQVAPVTAGDNIFGGLLKFAFYGKETYTKLISSPGLTATVFIDRESHRFININFKSSRQS
jgi:hypothetical protein